MTPVSFIAEWAFTRAALAAAVRAPDSEVLALLSNAAGSGCCRKPEVAEPEWTDFLSRMASGGSATHDDRVAWEQYLESVSVPGTWDAETLYGACVRCHAGVYMLMGVGLLVPSYTCSSDMSSSDIRRELVTNLVFMELFVVFAMAAYVTVVEGSEREAKLKEH